MTDNSFWHKLTDQQTTTSVGLGYVTTTPSDPSMSYWPGPGCIPPFKIGREWITHYTSAKFSSKTNDSTKVNANVALEEFGTGVGQQYIHTSQDTDSFVSDILITYKLKNPIQFLRDIFDGRYLEEFVSRFNPDAQFYLVTGYKVSRNVHAALDQQDSSDSSLRFEVSPKLPVVPVSRSQTMVVGGKDHDFIGSIKYQAPGDSVFFVRYQRIELISDIPGLLVVPPPLLTWKEWLVCGFLRKQVRTVIAPKGSQGQRMLMTRDPAKATFKKMQNIVPLAGSGRRTTEVSGDCLLDFENHHEETCS